jgi:hypothetical protein
MTLPISISSLFHGKAVEWERLEFKEGWNPLEALHTLCAFANDFHNLGGGYIVVGVAQRDGQPVLPPVGLDAARLDALQKEILNFGHSAGSARSNVTRFQRREADQRQRERTRGGGAGRPVRGRRGSGAPAGPSSGLAGGRGPAYAGGTFGAGRRWVSR